MRYFFNRWLVGQEINFKTGDPHFHTGGDDYIKKAVQSGDILFTIIIKKGIIYLIGKLFVGKILSYEQAKEILLDKYEPINKSDHIFAKPETITNFRKDLIIPLEILQKIRFKSRKMVLPLILKNGKVDGQAIGLREITNDSADLLDSLLNIVNPFYEEIDSIVEKIRKEGKVSIQQHKIIERNSEVARIAKDRRKRQDPFLRCEVCELSFKERYGERGLDYIEAHHKNFLCKIEGEREVSPSDFIMLCSNCHKMIHRKEPWLNIDELKKIINTKF